MKKISLIHKKIIVLLVLVFSLQSLGWGALGHRTVGLLAEANLTPKARNSVKYLLDKETLAGVANWADSLRSGTTYRQTLPYHYEKVPANSNYLLNLKNLGMDERAKGGVVQALIIARDTLRNYKTTYREKVDALKFLVHFVGDIHQPLHTGRENDKGGNDVPVNWFNNQVNLHKVWDSSMIYSAHKDFLKDNQDVETQSYIYARYLVKVLDHRFRFQRSDFDQWITESLYIRESGVYDKMYEQNQLAYQNKMIQVIDSRILLSGMRLADVLNQIFEGAQIPQAEISFRRQIEQIVGNLYQFISLRP